MKNTPWIVLFLFLAAACGRSSDTEQNLPSRTHAIAAGLSNNNIYDIEQDTCGQIWFATFRGLNRYDSRDFHHYFADYADSTALPHDQIRDLIVDKKGRLWVGTVNGLCLYTEDDCFYRHPRLNHGLVFQMEHGPDSTIVFNVNYSLRALHTANDSIETLIDYMNLQTGYTPKIHVDSASTIWIVGNPAILKYDYASRSLTDSIPVNALVINSFTVGHDIWLTTDRSTLVFNTLSGQFVPLPKALSAHPLFKNSQITCVSHHDDDKYLIQTASDGLFIYDRATGELIHQNDSGFPFQAPDFKVSTIFSDSSKNIWFGGVDQGFDAHYHYLDRFNTDNKLRTLMQGKSVVSMCFDRSHNLWMATRNDGLFIYDELNGAVRHYSTGDVTPKIPGKDVYFNFVFVDSQGYIWLSVTSAQLLRCSFDWNNGLKVLNRFSIWGAMEITEDSNGTLWVGTASPFVYFIPRGSDEATRLQVFSGGSCFIPAIRQISGNTMLVAAFNQPLKCIDIDSREISLLPTENSLDTVLKRTVFIPTDILPLENGDIWIGTVGNGLVHYSAADRRFSLGPEAACNDISALAGDNSGNLWISTLFGMSRLDSVTGRINNFYVADGIGSNQFYDRSKASRADNEELAFGGTHGITTFNPESVTRHIEAPLIFQDLKVHNQIIRPGENSPIQSALALKPHINLEHNQNSFAISFVAVDYCENPRVSYKYMLEGFDPSWIEASQNHEAAYSNVSAGKYKFKVRLSDDDTGASEIMLHITVFPTPWLSWWAILLYILAGIILLVVCIYFLLKIRAERQARLAAQRDKEQERRINDMNMRFFANVSHEFRTPLTMISGPIKQLEASDSVSSTDKQLLSIAQINVNRMLKLVNQLLDFNKLENDMLRLEVADTDVAALLRDVSLSFAMAAKHKDIDFVTIGFEQPLVAPIDSDKIIKIYCNLLSNALKFTPKGGRIKICLDVKQTDDAGNRRLVIAVENTGKRIPDDQLEKIFRRYYQLENDSVSRHYTGSGIGLYYARALARIHHGSLVSPKTDFDGAAFVLELPADDVFSASDHASNPSQVDSFPIEEDTAYADEPGADSSDDTNTILVVDDDIQVANYLKVLLSPVYKVATAFDAESALQWLSENRPALIISDVVMPGIDGYELCRRIKADLDLCHIPVLLVTAKAAVENQVEGFNAEANAYITKPFDPALLLSLIGSLLRNRDKVRQLATTSTSVDGVEPEIITPQDSAFLTGLYQLMEDELSNTELDINNISRKMMMSRTKFYYKVKGLTGETPSVFFRTYKLNRATELIAERRYTLSEIADRTGFSTLSHFSRSFKKQFGISPSDYHPQE